MRENVNFYVNRLTPSLGVAGKLLILFMLVSLFPLAVEASEVEVYVEDQSGIRWRSGEIMTPNIFATITDSTVAISEGEAEKVIAPGTSGRYSFTIYNKHHQEIVYTVSGKNDNQYQIPLEFKLRVTNGPWIKGSGDEWSLWNQTFPLKYQRSLGAGKSDTIELEWRWRFERGYDQQDTSLGERAMDEELTYALSLNVIAELKEELGNVYLPPARSGVTSSNVLGQFLPQTGESDERQLVLVGALICLGIYLLRRLCNEVSQ